MPLAALRPDLPELIVACISQAMARDREHRFVDASAFRRALSSAAERCFEDMQVRRSELPARAPRSLMELPSSLQPTLAQNDVAPQRWGDFEGLDLRADEPAERVSPPPPAAAPAPAPAPAAPVAQRPAAAGRAGSSASMPRVSAPEVRVSPRAKGGQRSGALAVDASASAAVSNNNPNEGPMLGDNPLDAFAGSAAVALELDLEPARVTAPRASATQVERRASTAQPLNVGLVSHTRAENRRSRPWLWFLPALLLVLFGLLLLAPGLFSYAPPSESSLRAREEQNPATRDSSRSLQRERPIVRPGTPAAERELGE